RWEGFGPRALSSLIVINPSRPVSHRQGAAPSFSAFFFCFGMSLGATQTGAGRRTAISALYCPTLRTISFFNFFPRRKFSFSRQDTLDVLQCRDRFLSALGSVIPYTL